MWLNLMWMSTRLEWTKAISNDEQKTKTTTFLVITTKNINFNVITSTLPVSCKTVCCFGIGFLFFCSEKDEGREKRVSISEMSLMQMKLCSWSSSKFGISKNIQFNFDRFSLEFFFWFFPFLYDLQPYFIIIIIWRNQCGYRFQSYKFFFPNISKIMSQM